MMKKKLATLSATALTGGAGCIAKQTVRNVQDKTRLVLKLQKTVCLGEGCMVYDGSGLSFFQRHSD